MNAASISRPEIITDNAADSDSDASSDGIPDYYTISSSDVDVDDNEPALNGFHLAVDQHGNISQSNGHDHPDGLIGDDEVREEQEMEEEEEMRRREESDAAMRRAFQEDESRRNAPLPSENAARVMEAMRGISFSGFAPHWSDNVAEDRWIHQLQRLRHPPSSAA